MDPTDEPHGPRGKRSLIVAEKSCRARERHRHIIRVLHLTKIAERHGRGILCPKHTKDKTRAVHDGNDHIHGSRIHSGLDDALHLPGLQRLNRGRRWRSDARNSAASAANKNHEEHGGKRQSQRRPDGQGLLPLLVNIARCHRLAQNVRRVHGWKPKAYHNIGGRRRSTASAGSGAKR